MAKQKLNKIHVAIVAFIFLGSMAGALLYSTGDENKEPEIPAEHILTEMSDNQKQFLLSKGYVVIDAEVPSACYLDCGDAKRGLEQAASAFSPTVYLVERPAQSQTADLAFSMESYRGTKNPSAFNATEVEEFICDNTPFRLDACVIRKIEFGREIPLNSPKNDSNATGGVTNETAQNATTNTTAAANSTGNASWQ